MRRFEKNEKIWNDEDVFTERSRGFGCEQADLKKNNWYMKEPSDSHERSVVEGVAFDPREPLQGA